MPLSPGDKRISVTYNPNNSYLTPDVPLQKESDPTQAHELARIMDTLGLNSYLGVVWVGQQKTYYTDSTSNNIAGYNDAPFNDLNDAYVAANSRFGTPGSGSPVAVILVGANTVETQSIQLCSDYVNVFGIGGSTVTGAAGVPIFTSCQGSGMQFEGVEFIVNGAPLIEVTSNIPLTNGATFTDCCLTDMGAAPSPPQALFDIHASMTMPIVCDRCIFNLNNWPLLYFDPNSNTNPFVMVVKNSSLSTDSNSTNIFQGLVYLGVKIQSSTLIVKNSSVSLFSCYSNGGTTFTEIDGLVIHNGKQNITYPVKLINSARYNTIIWNGINSLSNLVINPSTFTDASFEGDLRNSQYARLSLNNTTMTLDGLRMLNCSGDTLFTVAAVTPATEFVNLHTYTTLSSTSDTTALITSPGAVGAKFFNCEISYLLHYAQSGGVFCGTVIGGSSYGLNNLICLNNPLRQCVLRGHSLLSQPFFTNNLVSSTLYPDVNLAGITSNDVNVPILIQDVKSQGIIDAPIEDLTQTPNRYCYVSNSAFTAHDDIVQPWFPSIPAADDPQADQRIFISGGARFPEEDTNDRDIGLRSVTYVQQLANRFGPLIIGDSSQATIIEGNAVSVTNPRAWREALNINYTTLYTRMSGGLTSLNITNSNFNSWTVFSFVAEAGLDSAHLKAISSNLPMVYTYIGNNTIQLQIPEPFLDVEWMDFVVSSLNSQEDASIPTPISSLDVTQAAVINIPTGVTTFLVTFSPSFTTEPIVIPTVAIPAGQPEIDWWIPSASITAFSFTVNLSAPLTVDGYILSYIAATTNG